MNTQRWKKTIVHALFVAAWLLLCLAPVSGVAHAQVPQTSCSEIWDTLITVSNSLGASRTLRIGQGLLATNNLDNCDQPAPPLPPGGSFEALISFGTTDYYTDYRPANLPGTITWLAKFQAGSGGDPVTFSWNPATLPGAGTWTLIDTVGGSAVNVNMRTQSSVTMPYTGITQLEIRYATTRCTVTAIASGNWSAASTWNTNCTGIPAVTDDVYIPAGMAVSFNNAATTVESLTLSQGGSLTFANANPLLVSDNAFLRGGSLLLGSTGNFAINGALTNLGVMQQTKTVNLLNENQPLAIVPFLNIGGYGGMTITSHTSLGSTTVKIKGGQICDSDNTSIWRCFTVTSTNNVTDAEIDFYYAANELNGSACATMRAWRSTGGHNWVSAGTAGTRSCASEPYSVHVTNVTVVNTGSFFGLRTTAPTAITLRSFHADSAVSHFPIPLALALAGLASLSAFALWISARKRAYSAINKPQ
jgi:hypothetical protein